MPQPRIPTAILQTRGAFEHDPARGRARANEPVPSGPLGDPPDRLDRDEREAWIELAAILPPGVAMNTDRWALEELVCLKVKCQRRIATAAERSELAKYLSKFGMTPADRSRVCATPEQLTRDEWDELDRPEVPTALPRSSE
jgi:hypothetical protein